MAGSTVPITSEHLLVEDTDTPADKIVYTLLTAPTNGDVVIDGSGVTSFTQQLVNDERVLFAHRGRLAGLSKFTHVFHKLKEHVVFSF